MAIAKTRLDLMIKNKIPPVSIDYDASNKDIKDLSKLYEKSDIISRNDVVIWLGDFNYRIGGIGTRDKVFDLYKQHAHTSLITRYDQLYQEKDIHNNIFHYFNEGTISHPPTYKFNVTTHTFDTSQKARIPSWTDRILYIDNCSKCIHEKYNLCDCNPPSANAPSPLKQQCFYTSPQSTAISVENIANNSINNVYARKLNKTHHQPCSKILLERYGSFATCSISDHRPVFAYFYININE
jgi:hypothetical protein